MWLKFVQSINDCAKLDYLVTENGLLGTCMPKN